MPISPFARYKVCSCKALSAAAFAGRATQEPYSMCVGLVNTFGILELVIAGAT